MTESNEKNWRELCSAAVRETDSEKFAYLVTQILQAFDERDRVTGPSERCLHRAEI